MDVLDVLQAQPLRKSGISSIATAPGESSRRLPDCHAVPPASILLEVLRTSVVTLTGPAVDVVDPGVVDAATEPSAMGRLTCHFCPLAVPVGVSRPPSPDTEGAPALEPRLARRSSAHATNSLELQLLHVVEFPACKGVTKTARVVDDLAERRQPLRDLVPVVRLHRRQRRPFLGRRPAALAPW